MNTTLGLKQNWKQFSLLVLVNAFVGGMVGLERSIFPRYAEEEFGLNSASAILSFIIAFGTTKAITNYLTGRLANRFGRKKLLVIGWIFALPVPLLLIYAPSWAWVVGANVLLGINQGLTWSSTVVMKIDLVGPKNRGLAMGFNEFSGYLAVGLMALLSGWVADVYGVTPYPFYIGLGVAAVGLLMSVLFVRDTSGFVVQEQVQEQERRENKTNIFMQTSFRHRALSSITQAGMINNLNDGMMWGLLPMLLLSLSYDLDQTGILVAIYPTVWGLSQLWTGRLSDLHSKRRLLIIGMAVQGLAILALPYFNSFSGIAILSIILGLGTAVVYPTFLAAIADKSQPVHRAESIGAFRMWRDLGYAIGAILSGVLVDSFGLEWAFVVIGGLTMVSAFVIALRWE